MGKVLFVLLIFIIYINIFFFWTIFNMLCFGTNILLIFVKKKCPYFLFPSFFLPKIFFYPQDLPFTLPALVFIFWAIYFNLFFHFQPSTILLKKICCLSIHALWLFFIASYYLPYLLAVFSSLFFHQSLWFRIHFYQHLFDLRECFLF